MEPAVPSGDEFRSSRPDPPTPVANRPAADAPIRRVQAVPGDMSMPNAPGAVPPLPEAGLPASPTAVPGGQSLSLEAALYGALTSNPDLVALRNSNVASPEAVEVARRFPTTLNPTLWVDVRRSLRSTNAGPRPTPDPLPHRMHAVLLLVAAADRAGAPDHPPLRDRPGRVQPAAMDGRPGRTARPWSRRTASSRRPPTAARSSGWPSKLADFNDQLLQTLRRRLEANQVAAADVALAEVENQATRQQVEAAQQDYATALTDLRNQIGIPETAGTAEPLGEFILPAIHPAARRPGADPARPAEPARDPRRAGRRSPGPARPSTWPRATASPRRSSGPSTRRDEAGDPVRRLRLHHPDPDPQQRQAPGHPARGRAPPRPR